MAAVEGRFATVRVLLEISAHSISASSAVPRRLLLLLLAAEAKTAIRVAAPSSAMRGAVYFPHGPMPHLAAGTAGFSEPKVRRALLSPTDPFTTALSCLPPPYTCAGIFGPVRRGSPLA